MRAIGQVVAQIVNDDTTIEPLGRKGLINVAQYAKFIKSTVEAELKTEVSDHSIQTALNSHFDSEDPDLLQSFNIEGLTVHPDLIAVSFERTVRSSQLIRDLYSKLSTNNSFVTFTQGINEVTIIADSDIANQFNDLISYDDSVDAIYYIDGLVGVTAKANIDYVNTPNYFHSLMTRLALKNINIVESVSTATETTFIVTKDDLQDTLDQLEGQLK